MRVYRRLLPSELPQLPDHLLRLTLQDRHSRFSAAVGAAYIEAHCRTFDALSGAIIGAFEAGVLRGAAEVRRLEPGLNARAEVAITVEADYQDQGIGTELLRRTLVYARNRGFKSLLMLCLENNRRIQSIARKFEGELILRAGQVAAEIAVPFPTQLTLIDEAVGDSVAFAAQWWEQLSRLTVHSAPGLDVRR